MWYSKKMKYIFVFYPCIYMYDSCKATSIEWTLPLKQSLKLW